jgi:type IV secretory pathway TrbD component
MAERLARIGLASIVHQGLIQPHLLGGIPRRAAILNGTITAALVQATRIYWLALIGVALHAGAYWLTKRDPDWLEIARAYMRTKRFYDV